MGKRQLFIVFKKHVITKESSLKDENEILKSYILEPDEKCINVKLESKPICYEE